MDTQWPETSDEFRINAAVKFYITGRDFTLSSSDFSTQTHTQPPSNLTHLFMFVALCLLRALTFFSSPVRFHPAVIRHYFTSCSSRDLRERVSCFGTQPLLRSLSQSEFFPTFKSTAASPLRCPRLFCKMHRGTKEEVRSSWQFQSDSSVGAEEGCWGDTGGSVLYSVFPAVLKWAENDTALQPSVWKTAEISPLTVYYAYNFQSVLPVLCLHTAEFSLWKNIGCKDATAAAEKLSNYSSFCSLYLSMQTIRAIRPCTLDKSPVYLHLPSYNI